MRHTRILSSLFARLIHEGISDMERTLRITCVPIVPVPPRPGKIRETGWDQIAELCTCLHFLWGYRILPMLERSSACQQKKLDRQQRLGQMGMSYRLRSSFVLEKLLHGCVPESVIVVDDIITTGATVEACSGVLRDYGISHVYAVSLFMAD